MKKVTTLEGFNRSGVITLKQIHADPLINLKKYADAYTNLGPGLDKNGFPVTGLTEDYTVPSSKAGAIPKKVEGTRRAMEKLLDLEPGTLKVTSPYWNTFFLKIGNEGLKLDLMSDYDLLQYLFASAQTIIANGMSEIGQNSSYEYVLSSDEQEAAVRVKNRQFKKDAYVLASKLDLETKMNVLAVYGEITDATNPNSIIDRIDDKIEEDAEKFLKIAEDGHLIYMSLITYALDKGVLTVEDGAIYHNEVVVGHTKELAAEAVAKDKKLEAILKAKISGDMELIKEALTTKE